MSVCVCVWYGVCGMVCVVWCVCVHVAANAYLELWEETDECAHFW